MYCSKCGGQNEEANQFCEHCGARLSASVAAKRSKGGSAGLRRIIIFVVGLVVLALFISVAWGWFSNARGNTPEGVVRKFVAAINRADTQAMKECVRPDQQAALEANWQGVIDMKMKVNISIESL